MLRSHLVLLAVLAVVWLCLLSVFFATSRQDTSVTLPDDVTIDDVIRGDLNYDPGALRFFPTSCRPQSNFVFIKCLQCSTGTVDMVFRRYGYVNNLPVALPVGEHVHLGWPRPFSARHVRPSSRGFSLLAEPAVYNGTVMRGLMNKDTVFFAMIRHPLDLLVSTIESFQVLEAANLTRTHGAAALPIYIQHIDEYEGVFKGRVASPGTPSVPDGFSLSKNLLSHCLGMPLGFPQDRHDISADFTAIKQYIHNLDSELLLVMIMEHVDESLVLLKRVMCWGFKDILHLGSDESSSFANISLSVLTQHDRDLHRRWSSADYQLYEHFHGMFWKKVDQHGEDFWEDVVYYRHLQREVRWFCRKVTPYGDSYIQFPETRVSPAFRVTSEDCRLMEAPLLDLLKERYQQQESPVTGRSSDTAIASGRLR
ncbi:galactose-3-O-sulfotransferase 2-like [Babylonia areolata]|uniref:galactose-3-O-sulfotransferase 2-like n=1 Tax=Babylonia areolata TaxID=304850 RepID=UPI003FD22E6A